jgi:branched-chain amino acid transport system permease protein
MKWLVLAVLLVLPMAVHSNFVLTIFVFSFILGMMAVSFNLIFGFTGQLSMFHAAAFGISAYITYLTVSGLHVSFWELARLIIMNWNDVTNGTLGLMVLDKPTVHLPGLTAITIDGTVAWYFFSLAGLVLTVAVCSLVLRSWIGRCFAAIRLDEDLAQTLGIDIFRYKLLSFTIANLLAALAGALYAFYTGYIEPAYLGIDQSLDVIAMVLLGGRGSITGPILGAFVLTGLPQFIDLSGEARAMLYGAILILTILLLPRGLVGTITSLRRAA